MAKKKVLLAGESWTSAATHIKGFDQFASISFHLGAEPLLAALAGSKFELTYMKAHEAATDFPLTLDALDAYSVVILSDLGSNTLLLHPDVWFRGETVPNRLKLLREWVGRGGALMMIGGYYSFQGINGGARYHKTAVEEVLPVDCLAFDDRVEVPEGFRPVLVKPEHEILAGLGGKWPVAPRLQRGDAEEPARRRAARQGRRRGWRPSASRHRHLRQGPDARLDIGYRAALAAQGLLRLGRLRPPLGPGADLADRKAALASPIAARGRLPLRKGVVSRRSSLRSGCASARRYRGLPQSPRRSFARGRLRAPSFPQGS